MIKRISFILMLTLMGLFSFQCSQRKIVKDNFILITLDTQRVDHISCYDPSNALTPNIDYLAQEGTLFENCYSHIPITLPSHASIFFSRLPHEIENYNNGQKIKEYKGIPTLAEIFKKNGYSTASFVSLKTLKLHFGLGKGFDAYDDNFPEGRFYLSAGDINNRVFPWLKSQGNRNFFLWIHYSDPHSPYAVPSLPPDLEIYLNDELVKECILYKYENYEVNLNLKKGINKLRFEVNNEFIENPEDNHVRFNQLDFSAHPDEKDLEIDFVDGFKIKGEGAYYRCKKQGLIELNNHTVPRQIQLTFRGKLNIKESGTRTRYKQEVEYMDDKIGDLWKELKELKLFDKTFITIVGDHGEGLGEYSNTKGQKDYGHVHFLYDIYLKVPLIFYDPHSSHRGIRIREPATLVDISPTILNWMEFRNLPSFQGRNLFNMKREESIEIYEETFRPQADQDKFAVLKYPWHLILTAEDQKFELYNLINDPYENENIYDEKNLPQEAAFLKNELVKQAREILMNKVEIKIDDKDKEMLRALGYIK